MGPRVGVKRDLECKGISRGKQDLEEGQRYLKGGNQDLKRLLEEEIRISRTKGINSSGTKGISR